MKTKEKRKLIKADKYASYRDKNRDNKEKPADFMATGKKLLSLLKGKEIAVIVTVVAACIGSLLSILGPNYLGKIIDVLDVQVKNKLATGTMDFSGIYSILLPILVIYVGSSVFSFIQHYIMAGVVQDLITRLRREINRKLSRLPLSYFDAHNKGDILSRITNDIDNINNTLQNSLLQIITSVVTFVGVLAIMIWHSKVLSAASLLPFPLCFVIAMTILRFSKVYFRRQWKVTGDVNGHIEEMFTGHKIVKAYGHEKKAIEEFDEINEALCESGR